MTKIRTDDIIVICGKRREGKSKFLKWLVKNFKRRIIWDVNHEHKTMGFNIHYPYMVEEQWKRGITRIVFQPFSKTDEDFEKFLEAIYNFNNFVLIIEEVEKYADSYHMPTTLKKFIDTGRHKGVGIVATLRRPARTHKDLLSNADHIFMFHQHLQIDVDYLKEWVGDKASEISNLPKFNYLHYDDREGTVVHKKKVPLYT